MNANGLIIGLFMISSLIGMEQKGQGDLQNDIDSKNDCDSQALIAAARNGHADRVRLLLDQPSIDLNDRYEALIVAAQNGHTGCVRLLLAVKGIDAQTKKQYQNLALMWAAAYDHKNCVEFLIADADPNSIRQDFEAMGDDSYYGD